MARIVTSTYRHKRPPGKRKPVAIEAPSVVTSVDRRTRMARRRPDDAVDQEKGHRRVVSGSGGGQGEDSRYRGDPEDQKKAAVSQQIRLKKADHTHLDTPSELERHSSVTTAEKTPQPANPRKSAIVTARKPGSRFSSAPDMTPEEHERRGDAADALFREMKRKAPLPCTPDGVC
jgi:hypothetical protein